MSPLRPYDVDLLCACGFQNAGPGNHDTEVDDVVVVTLEHDPDDVLPDVVDVTFDCGQQDPPLGVAPGALFVGFQERDEMCHGLLHDPGALHDLRQEHLSRAEQVTDDVHARHQGPFNDLDGAPGTEAGLLGVLHDVLGDAVDHGVRQPIFDRLLAPLKILDRVGRHCLDVVRDGEEPVGRVRSPILDHILHPLTEVGVDFGVDRQLARVDNPHVHAGLDGVIQKYGVHRLANALIAAEREGQIGDTTADQGAGTGTLDLTDGFEVVTGVVVMFLEARGDRENVRIEDDVLRRDLGHLGKQAIGALAYAHLSFYCVGLSLLIEGHHDHGHPYLSGEACMAQEGLFSFLQADRVDHTLALEALEPLLQNGPLRGINHHGHAGDVRLGGDQAEERGHGLFGVEQALVHVDVDHLRAVVDLLACNVDCGFVVVLEHQSGESSRPGHIGSLANIHEQTVGVDSKRLEPTQARCRRKVGNRAWGHPLNHLREGFDMCGGRSATATDDIQGAVTGETPQDGGHALGCFVVATQFVGQAGVGVSRHEGRRHTPQVTNVGCQGVRAEGTVEPHDERFGVSDRIPERFDCLS